LEAAALEYVADHYPNGVATIYAKDGNLIVAIVDNKYNPANFWNGRWRSLWTISPDTGNLMGSVKVNVHYYEDGNVQLNCHKEIEVSVTADLEDLPSVAAAYIKQISKEEHEYQTSLTEAYTELSDNTFKSLRRALPMTRHKIDWDKIFTYKIGQELSHK